MGRRGAATHRPYPAGHGGVAGTRTCRVRDQVFFASAVQSGNGFDYLHTPPKVTVDLPDAHFWDTSALAALDRVVFKLRRHGAEVDVGLNQASESLEQLGTHRGAATGATTGH